jgi:uncharacterized membrane protein
MTTKVLIATAWLWFTAVTGFPIGTANKRSRIPHSPWMTTTTTTSRFLADTSDGSTTSTERPDPSILLSAQDDRTQRLGFIGISTSLALGTVGAVQFLSLVESILTTTIVPISAGWFQFVRETAGPVALGVLFAAAGVAHFVLSHTFGVMVPPRGTWGGMWQVPALGAEQLGWSYAEYHTYWTGVAELAGGIFLMASALGWMGNDDTTSNVLQLPALLLFGLVVAVTPANIYMATHDIPLPGAPLIPYPEGHVVRGLAQCVLLAELWKLAFP